MKVTNNNAVAVPNAMNTISFSIEGPGEIVATDNGDPADLVHFTSKERKAFFGLALVIVKSRRGTTGTIKVKATATGLHSAELEIKSK